MMQHEDYVITVFLADDHTMVRDGLRALLEAHPDIQVIGDASNGREAVLGVAELCPDVVLIDITMPELNGIEATREISRSCDSSKVIILSMHSTTEHIFRALRAGARGYLLKESAGIELVKAVRLVYTGHRYLSQKISDTVIENFVHQRLAAESESPIDRLSSREQEVLQLVVEGKSNSQIAERLSISPKTVETYRSRLMNKLGISNLPELVKFAIQHGLTPLD